MKTHVGAPQNEEDGLESMLCSTFCSTCQEMFTGDIERYKNSNWFLHHRSLSAIEHAVRENCYICSRSWTNATIESADFFKLSPETSATQFSMRYQVLLEHDASGSSSGSSYNTIRIIFACDRQQDGIPNIRHIDNFLAFSSQGMLKYILY